MERRMRWCVTAWAAVLALPLRAAAASSVSDEAFANSSTPINEPAEREVGDTLSGDWEIDRRWDVNARLSYARVIAAPPVTGAKFGDSAGNVVEANLGGEVDVTPHLELTAGVNGSPPSTTFATNTVSTISSMGGAETADAQLRTSASSYGAGVGAGFDTGQTLEDLAAEDELPEPHPVDVQVLVNGGVTQFDSRQAITHIAIGNRSVAVTLAGCDKVVVAGRRKECLAVLAAEKGETAADVAQVPLSLAVIATILHQTDVGVTGTYFGYSTDPANLGFFGPATAGRGTVSFGAGLPIEPLLWALRPEIGHDFFGVLTPTVLYEHGEYVDNLGYSDALSLKLKVRITSHWKAWAQLTGERDVDSDGDATPAYYGALGVRYLF